MALLICPDCGRNVSDQAETCPGCGYPVSKIKETTKSTAEIKPQQEATQPQATASASSQTKKSIPFWIKALIASAIFIGLFLIMFPPTPSSKISEPAKTEKSETAPSTKEDAPFLIKDITIDDSFGITNIKGDMTNNSGKSYKSAIFKMSFYDAADKLIGACDIAILNFQKGETATFDGLTTDDISSAETYRLRLDMGI